MTKPRHAVGEGISAVQKPLETADICVQKSGLFRKDDSRW
jgi:hypothetical protein